MKTLLKHAPAALLAVTLVACAGSTSFLDGAERYEMTLVPGATDTIILEFEAVGSHAGTYTFSTSQSFGDGLTATVNPTSAEVDGVLELEVTITADSDPELEDGGIYVEGTNGDEGAGTTVWVTIPR